MYPFFHVFLPIVLFVVTGVDVRLKINRLAFSIALMLPDLIDKLLMWTVGATGRSWAHNLLFVALAGIPFLLARKYPIANGVWLGALIHLVLDIPSVPWLFPFISYDLWGANPPEYTGGFWDYFLYGLTNPTTLITEIGGIICLVWLISKYELLSKTGLTAFFRNLSSIKIGAGNQ